MDLLCNAYSNHSDEDDDPKPKLEPETSRPPSFPSSRKRPRFENQIAHSYLRSLVPHEDAPILGKYISKRERGQFSSLPGVPEPDSVPNSPVLGSISDSNIHGDILSLLRNKAKNVAHQGKM